MYSYKGLTRRTKAKYCNYGKQCNYAQLVQLEIVHVGSKISHKDKKFILNTVKTLVF